MKKPRPLSSILEETLRALEIARPMKAYSILGAWKQLVGEAVSEQTRPRLIRNRVLIVDVSHPAWMHHLQFLKLELLGKVNAFVGGRPVLDDIRFRVAKIPQDLHPSGAGGDWRNERLSAEVLERIRGATASVHDGDLEESIRDLLINGAKVEQYRKRRSR